MTDSFVTLPSGIMVDEEDAHFLKAGRVSVFMIGKTQYARIGDTYLHHLIMGAVRVDHKDHNGLNNRRLNLRSCTHAQNLRNRGPQTNNTTGFKGVCFDKQRKRWIAHITVMGVQKYLGRHATPEAAARAYDEAAIREFGEFALPNFPTSASERR